MGQKQVLAFYSQLGSEVFSDWLITCVVFSDGSAIEIRVFHRMGSILSAMVLYELKTPVLSGFVGRKKGGPGNPLTTKIMVLFDP